MKKHSMIAARGFRMTPAERKMGRLMRSPDGHPAEGQQQQQQTEQQPQQEQQQEQSQAPTAEEIAQLRADLAAAQAAAAKFDGIDPEVAKANAKKVADAEKAARDAETAKAQAEGNFERLRELQNEEHQAQLAAAQAERDDERTRAAQAAADAVAARREAAFAKSKFFASETILTADRAERLYGDYVEIENGVTVVYDAPKSAAKRTVVMDTKGKPLSFDDAMKKVFENEPDKDSFLKSKITPGANSKTQDGKVKDAPTDRLGKLAAGLAKLRG